MIAALAFGIGLAFCAAAVLAWAPRAAAASRSRNAARIDALLPQTQCGQCGYPGCRPYAEAVARGDAAINRCPPGGAAVIRAMADMLGVDFLPLDPACGTATPPQTVVIDEDVCIGCTKCLRVCPVDAIVGAPKLMHTVIAAQCTGCGLCIPPCPVDCIEIVPQQRGEWRWPRPLP